MSKSFRAEVLGQLQEMGSDIEQPHDFDFYLYLPTELTAKQAADKVRERTFTAEVLPSATGEKWVCRATATIVPETAPLDEMSGFLEQVATALGGEFDGWESDVIRG
jgi:hypothetical protein